MRDIIHLSWVVGHFNEAIGEQIGFLVLETGKPGS